LSYCVVKGDSIVEQHAFALEKFTNKGVPADEAVYLFASISKTVTCVAIMQLYEESRIDLDADINLYLPFALRNPNHPQMPLTTRMLLTHSSSLSWPSLNQDPEFSVRFKESEVSPLREWVEHYLTPDGDIFHPAGWKSLEPGERYQYSNIGGAVLGLLVESVTGQDFAAYCTEHIFRPMGMNNSGFRLHDIEWDNLVTPLHEGEPILQYSVPHYPASMLKSTMADFTIFMAAIMNGGVYKEVRILEAATIEEMLTIQDPTVDIAHIWNALSPGWMGHIGGYWGVTSCFDINRESQTAVLLLSND